MFAFPLHPTQPVSFFDLMTAAAAAGTGATACAAAGPARARNAPKKAPSPPPAAAPKPAPKPASHAKSIDMMAVATRDGWTYSLDLPGRTRDSVEIEVVASTDAAGAARLVITAPEVPASKGKRARAAIHIAFDLEHDADVHSITANAADGELVIAVRKTEPVRPLKLKIAVGAGAGDGLVEQAAAAAVEAAPAAAPAADDEDGSWVEDDDDGEGSAKGGEPASGAVLEEAT